MTLHPAPPVDAERPNQWRLRTVRFRLAAGDPLAEVKSASKLVQVLARAEAEAHGADEALLLNSHGEIAEGAGSNIFWIEGGAIYTAPLTCGILPGITRKVVLELCRELNWPVLERGGLPPVLLKADGVFLTASTWGIIEATSLNGRALGRSVQTNDLHRAYQSMVANAG
jgi:branched-subunit amino acid aminotransferase/4-amino-4-deoxychorismate lyase